MAGRKPIPDRIKLVKGTAKKHRMNADAPVPNAGIPAPPEWLSDRAIEIFSRLTVILGGMGVASPDDEAALAILASRMEEIELCTAFIEDNGRTYERRDETGALIMARARPEVGMRSEAMRHAQSLLSEFGLTPSARSKVSVGQSTEANPFAALEKEFGF
jgi:P27 family predicted phage terminase small subunit